MASPVDINGNYQAELGGLGFALSNVGGYGTITGPVLLTSMSITVKNPNGASVFIFGGSSAYVSTAGTMAYFYVQIDGGAWSSNGMGRFYFNQTNTHTWMGDSIYVASLAAGSHTLGFVLNPSGGTIYSDGNDHTTWVAWEMPGP